MNLFFLQKRPRNGATEERLPGGYVPELLSTPDLPQEGVCFINITPGS